MYIPLAILFSNDCTKGFHFDTNLGYLRCKLTDIYTRSKTVVLTNEKNQMREHFLFTRGSVSNGI